MKNKNISIISRRTFMQRSLNIGLAAAAATTLDIPLLVKRALAEGSIGLNGKKLLFIWLRGANDGLNSLVPVGDPEYGPGIRPNIHIPRDPGVNYSALGPCDYPVNASSTDATYSYDMAIRTGNGFAALHPSLKFMAPVYNAGDLAIIHRVGYPNQSRSHFDSQNYWENGTPRNGLVNDGILYRTMVESGLANTAPLTGVSVQSSLPLILRGSRAAMTNLGDPTRYDLLAIPNSGPANTKVDNAILAANDHPFPLKDNRELLRLQYKNLSNTLDIFANIDFTDGGNTFRDNEITDNDTEWAAGNGGEGYYLFPTSSAINGGWQRPGGAAQFNKYVVDTGGHGFFRDLKNAAMILNHTDAIVAGTEYGGFDTHNNQAGNGGTGATGSHADLNRRLGWAYYALRKYFTRYADKATWENTVIVTLTEFGRTTVENGNIGTDHAEAGVMWVAGGAIRGYNQGNPSGIFGCHNAAPVPWITGPANQGGGVDGTMFGISDRYVKRSVDYRSVLGEIIRDHLGATQPQLDRIIPGYADEANEHLRLGGVSAYDDPGDESEIEGELGILPGAV